MVAKKEKEEVIYIRAPKTETLVLKIRGTAPLVTHKFSQKALNIIRGKQAEGDQAKNTKKREPKDFAAEYEAAKHKNANGKGSWCGIPATGLKAAMIKACTVSGMVMTRAKLLFWIESDGVGDDGTPLIKITKGEPHPHEGMVHLKSGRGGSVADVRIRPMWNPGWEATVRIKYDSDLLAKESVVNLLAMAGERVGVCEGRPGSTESCGMGWGTFELVD